MRYSADHYCPERRKIGNGSFALRPDQKINKQKGQGRKFHGFSVETRLSVLMVSWVRFGETGIILYSDHQWPCHAVRELTSHHEGI